MNEVDLWHAERWRHHLGWDPSPDQCQQMRQLFELVIQGNRQQNLTRITDPQEFWEKHLWDSLRPVQGWVQDPSVGGKALRVIDIGSGAGFPGLPVAMAYPQWSVMLLDATQRRMQFAAEVAETLELTNILTTATRAETWGQHQRDHYDLALSRALGSPAVCAELSLPLLKVGGQALLYRGHWDPEQEQVLRHACEILGGTVIRVDPFVTPLSQGIRHSVVLEKVAPTPVAYPRGVGIPTKRPLG